MARRIRVGQVHGQPAALFDEQRPRQIEQGRFPRLPALRRPRRRTQRRLERIVDQPQQIAAHPPEDARESRVDARTLKPSEQRPREARLVEPGEEVGEANRAPPVGAEQHTAQLMQHGHPVDHEVAVAVRQPVDPLRQVESRAVGRRPARGCRAFQVEMPHARPVAGSKVGQRPDVGRARQHRLDVDLEDAGDVVEGDRGQGNSVDATSVTARWTSSSSVIARQIAATQASRTPMPPAINCAV